MRKTQPLIIRDCCFYFNVLIYRLIDDSGNTAGNITNCIILNISSNVLFYKIIHFVIIISISKVFQVQNRPMDFLPLGHEKVKRE